MTDSPENFADRPNGAMTSPHAADSHSEHVPDVLSVLLRAVRLRGEELFCCAQIPPFAVQFDHPGGTLHIVAQGEIELELDDGSPPCSYERGDVFLLPAGRPHTIRHGDGVIPRPLAATDQRQEVVTYGEGTRWLAGTFSFDDSRAASLLHGLPPLIELRGAGVQSLLWLDVSAQMLMKEKLEPTQGSAEMISRILGLLFIHVLRTWATGPEAAPGWLTGAMDPVVGGVITAIHADPGKAWTIERLADMANLSRSAFAERFTRRVGQPPATYLSQVRLADAASRLVDTHDSVGAVAVKVGYDSEAAFSRAFSKRYGMPPARWRRQAASIPMSAPGAEAPSASEQDTA
jgi:AraC-like DNA-binding protein